MFTLEFWKAAGERAIKTFAQALAAMLVASGSGIVQAPWLTDLSVAGMAAILSVLTSLASGSLAGTGGPSLGPETLSTTLAAGSGPGEMPESSVDPV